MAAGVCQATGMGEDMAIRNYRYYPWGVCDAVCTSRRIELERLPSFLVERKVV